MLVAGSPFLLSLIRRSSSSSSIRSIFHVVPHLSCANLADFFLLLAHSVSTVAMQINNHPQNGLHRTPKCLSRSSHTHTTTIADLYAEQSTRMNNRVADEMRIDISPSDCTAVCVYVQLPFSNCYNNSGKKKRKEIKWNQTTSYQLNENPIRLTLTAMKWPERERRAFSLRSM